MLGYVATEDVNGVKLRNIMNKGYDLSTKSTAYNQESLHVFDFSKKVDTLIPFSEDIDVVNNIS
jgi:hypothetical protein